MTRKKFKEYYQKKTLPGADGPAGRVVYEYTGEYYLLGTARGSLKKQKILLAVSAAGAFTLYACAGFINAQGLRVFYILLPFVAAFLPGALLLIGAMRLLLTRKSKLTIFDVSEMHTRTRRSAAAAAVLCAAACAGEIALLVLKRRDMAGRADLYVLALCFSAAILFFFAWKTARTFSCRLIPGTPAP
ncbi:MAG TPA: hypothetical protein PL044_02420 [Clostridiales bacterium]|nr:MAG: hypothetical protein BWY37_00198 [Firmicutes bacterium ADurb.Bin262]HOU11270.1 hypothetical protein [Clostridiales bacterium]HQK72618.1 hypothetical protein [Clostridiales bacterium]